MKNVKRITIVFALFCLSISTYATPTNAPFIIEKLKHQKLVDRFYEIKGETLFWFRNDESVALRQTVKNLIDSAVYLGLEKERYHYKWISTYVEENAVVKDSNMRSMIDRIYTDALISFCKDIYGGADLSWLDNEKLKQKFEAIDNAYILIGLSAISSPVELQWFTRFLEPPCDDYQNLKQELRNKILNDSDTCAVKQLSQSLNVLRWIKHYKLTQVTAARLSEETQLLCSWLW